MSNTLLSVSIQIELDDLPAFIKLAKEADINIKAVDFGDTPIVRPNPAPIPPPPIPAPLPPAPTTSYLPPPKKPRKKPTRMNRALYSDLLDLLCLHPTLGDPEIGAMMNPPVSDNTVVKYRTRALDVHHLLTQDPQTGRYVRTGKPIPENIQSLKQEA